MDGRTVLVLGDQLSRGIGALARADAARDRVVMLEVGAKLRLRPWHRHKLTYVLSAMRHFAQELRDAGFSVDHRYADTLRQGLQTYRPEDLVTMAPSSWDLRGHLRRWGVEQVPNNAFIAGEDAFAEWTAGRRRLVLDDFYRQVRRDHGWLIDGGDPVGGRWSYDADNRQPPPNDGVDPPKPYRPREDDIDAQTRRDVTQYERDLDLELYGEDRPRRFPVTAAEAKRSLRSFLDRRLEGFGPLEDAVVDGEPFLWHSLLSAPLNLGLLHPVEVCDRVDQQYRRRRAAGEQPHLASYEGFLRQVGGWREYMWGLYWWRMPAWRTDDALDAHGPVPDFYWTGETDMNCVHSSVADLLERSWTHHIQRLMVLGNFALLAGVNPQRLTDWYHGMYIDAHEWVMLTNVVGMSQWADGGVTATKPYAASANYINRMTTYCSDCRYDPTTRTDDDSCPFNALYWDFLSHNRVTLATNRRMMPVIGNLDRFSVTERRHIRERARLFRADT